MQGRLSLGIKLLSSSYMYALRAYVGTTGGNAINMRLLLHGNNTSLFKSLALKTHGKTKMRLRENQDN